MLLENKIALVTSSTRGIGKAIAEKFASEGAKVYLGVRNKVTGQKVVDEIRAKGGKAEQVYFDAYKKETYASVVQDVVKAEGRIDVLVNNYGETDVTKDFDLVNTRPEDFMETIDKNVMSVYITSQEAVKSMLKSGGGTIVNISSIGGAQADLARISYGTAKATINFLTKNIALQYASANIRANSLMPGATATEAVTNNMSQSFIDAFLMNVPLGRMGTPEEMANVALFLASDMSSYVTGEVMSVAGGMGMGTPMYAMYKGMTNKG